MPSCGAESSERFGAQTPGMPAGSTVAMIGALSVRGCLHAPRNPAEHVYGGRAPVAAGTSRMLISPMWQIAAHWLRDRHAHSDHPDSKSWEIACPVEWAEATWEAARPRRDGGDCLEAAVAALALSFLSAFCGPVEDRRRLGWHAEPRSHGTVDD